MKNIAINMNSSKDKDGEILNKVVDVVKNKFKESVIKTFQDSIGLNAEENKNMDIVIAFGGDGTILSTARALTSLNTPILGVNIGNLGFLTAVENASLEEALDFLYNGQYYVEERLMLQCSIINDNKEIIYHCLNDIVISKGTLSRIVKYDISIDNNFYTTFVSDGVIVSTPTGSTAYSLSAGGPIVDPTLDLIAITPICPHSLGIRTTVISDKSTVSVDMKNVQEKVFLTVDGQEFIELDKINKVMIFASKEKCKLIKLPKYNYFDVLRKKIISRTRDCEGE